MFNLMINVLDTSGFSLKIYWLATAVAFACGLLVAIAAFLLWETCILMYPERFWEQTNAALKCSECTDKLCTQYCRKLRK